MTDSTTTPALARFHFSETVDEEGSIFHVTEWDPIQGDAIYTCRDGVFAATLCDCLNRYAPAPVPSLKVSQAEGRPQGVDQWTVWHDGKRTSFPSIDKAEKFRDSLDLGSEETTIYREVVAHLSGNPGQLAQAPVDERSLSHQFQRIVMHEGLDLDLWHHQGVIARVFEALRKAESPKSQPIEKLEQLAQAPGDAYQRQAMAEIQGTMLDNMLNAEQKITFIAAILRGELANPPKLGGYNG